MHLPAAPSGSDERPRYGIPFRLFGGTGVSETKLDMDFVAVHEVLPL